MKVPTLLLLAAATAALLFITQQANAAEDKVVVLGDSSLHDYVKQNEFVLVEFYAPWCGEL